MALTPLLSVWCFQYEESSLITLETLAEENKGFSIVLPSFDE